MAADADSGSLGSRFKGLLNGSVLSNSGEKISGKGISCGGGVHSLDLAGGLLHPVAGVLIDAPFGTQRQDNPAVGNRSRSNWGYSSTARSSPHSSRASTSLRRK